jgi:biotin transport system substrate-specific component
VCATPRRCSATKRLYKKAFEDIELGKDFSVISSLIQVRTSNAILVRLIAISFFAALTAVTARITLPLPFTPVPVTLQVLAVLLAGFALGAKDGAASQIVYITTIAAGLPLDVNGLGTAVLFSPTAGYLIGFIPGAFVAGCLAEKGFNGNRKLRFVAGLVGVGVIYLCGASWLTIAFLQGSWALGWAQGVVPFIGIDLAKAIIASGAAESARLVFKR